jgi:hypothetical protein
MHLVGPYLSTTGKRKGKQKFRNAAEAQRARDLEQSWNDLKNKWGAGDSKRKNTTTVSLPTTPGYAPRQTGERPKSLSSWNVGAVTSKPTQQYTGTNIVGIGTLHKSNAVPIFTNQEAKDIATMRR